MNATNRGHDALTHTRLIVRVLQDLVATAPPFDTYADLADALKQRLADLKIYYDAALISEALDRLELGGSHRLVPVARTPRLTEPAAEPPISHEETLAILKTLRVRSVATMPKVRELSDEEIGKRQWSADRLKAYRLVQQQILDTAQHVAALEEAVESEERDALG
jgi:hypothetical protein